MYYLKGQKHFNDCGSACVATILGLYGIEYNYKDLVNIHSFLDIMVTLNSYNINCCAYKKKDIDIFPSIIQVKKFNRFHFIVLYKKVNNKYLYYCPNKLITHTISEKRLKKIYTNNCINILTIRPYNNYKFDIFSLPYSIKLIIIDIFLINLIFIILKNML